MILLNLFIRNEKLNVYIRYFPITTILIALNIAYFVYIKFLTGKMYWIEAWGIFDAQKIAAGEWYRLFTAMFTHLDFVHLFLNLISVYLFASVVEQLTSKWKYTLLYVGSGFLSYVLVYIISDAQFTVGASGAVFAVFGALFYLSRKKPHLFDGSAKSTLYIIILFNVVATFLFSGVSITGHLGGLVAGYLFARILQIEQR